MITAFDNLPYMVIYDNSLPYMVIGPCYVGEDAWYRFPCRPQLPGEGEGSASGTHRQGLRGVGWHNAAMGTCRPHRLPPGDSNPGSHDEPVCLLSYLTHPFLILSNAPISSSSRILFGDRSQKRNYRSTRPRKRASSPLKSLQLTSYSTNMPREPG